MRRSRIQVSKIAVYWAVSTLGIGILWAISLSAMGVAGTGPALSLVGPMILGALVAVGLYYRRDHQTLEYDDSGYEITTGRKSVQKHRWTEFTECSLIRDTYGRSKVRCYVERDGKHFEIDSSACGVNPYALRDFVTGRMRDAKVAAAHAEDNEVMGGLESEIQRGRAAWIADLNETFRDYQVSGEVFQLVARGSTRPKGFLLSRFLALTVMPNYEVCLYAEYVHRHEETQRSHLMRLIRLIETQRDQKNIKWSWLLLFCNEEVPSSLIHLVEEFGNKDVGIGCVDVGTGKLVTSPNQLGKSIGNQMRLQHLIRDLRRRTRKQPTL